jgi:hypothetical protein
MGAMLICHELVLSASAFDGQVDVWVYLIRFSRDLWAGMGCYVRINLEGNFCFNSKEALCVVVLH